MPVGLRGENGVFSRPFLSYKQYKYESQASYKAYKYELRMSYKYDLYDISARRSGIVKEPCNRATGAAGPETLSP